MVREAPPSAGGGLRYLGRDDTGRPVWTRDAAAAERHPTLRDASRAALTAPPLAGAMRPAFAVPVSVAETASEGAPTRPVLRLVVSDGAPLEPAAETTDEREADWPPGPGAWLWLMWAPWLEAWQALLFGGREQGPRDA